MQVGGRSRSNTQIWIRSRQGHSRGIISFEHQRVTILGAQKRGIRTQGITRQIPIFANDILRLGVHGKCKYNDRQEKHFCFHNNKNLMVNKKYNLQQRHTTEA